MQSVKRVLVRAGLATAALATALLVGCGEPALRGTAFEPPIEVPTFSFTQADGSTFSTAPAEGQLTLVFFGYSFCPDVCPLTLSEWARARTLLGPEADQVRWLFVSVDTDRDSPLVAQQYAQQFDSAFVGLSGSTETVAAMQQAFSVASYTTPGERPEDYLVTHASQSFLMDAQGRLRAMYAFNSSVPDLVADLRALLKSSD